MQRVQVPVSPPDPAAEVTAVAQLGKAMDESSPNQTYWVSQEKLSRDDLGWEGPRRLSNTKAQLSPS